MNVEINIEKVNEEKDRLNSLLVRLKEIENKSVEKTKLLKEYWQSKTAELYFEDFEIFRQDFDQYIEDCKGIVSYLQNVVANGYSEYDENANKVVSEEF